MIDDLPRGNLRHLAEKTKEWTRPLSAWKDPAKVIELFGSNNPDPSKFFLSADNGTIFSIKDDRHICLFAGSRGGKGESLIVPNLLFSGGSAFILDFKGELCAITARERAKTQKVCVLDPFGITPPWIKEFQKKLNPMAILKLGSPSFISDAGLIADGLIETPTSGDLHWSRREKTLVKRTIIHVAVFSLFEGNRNLITVNTLLNGDLKMLSEDMFNCSREVKDESIKAVLEAGAVDLRDSSETELANVIAGIRANLEFLELPEMANILTGHDFDLTELKTASKGLSLYVVLPTSRIPSCYKWLRIILNLSLEAMERVTYKPDPPVRFYLDEIAQLGFSRPLLNAVSYVAGAGAQLLMVWQDISQIKDIYKTRYSTFIANSGVTIGWALTDLDTLNFFEKKLGKCPVLATSKNITTKDSVGTETESYEMHPLLAEDEIRRYFSRSQNRMMIFVNELDPISLPRVKYWDSSSQNWRMFKNKYDDYEQWKKEQQ